MIIIPILLSYGYNFYFNNSGNWLETYQNQFKIGFLILSLASSIWLLLKSVQTKSKIWVTISTILIIGLTIFIYLSISIIRMLR